MEDYGVVVGIQDCVSIYSCKKEQIIEVPFSESKILIGDWVEIIPSDNSYKLTETVCHVEVVDGIIKVKTVLAKPHAEFFDLPQFAHLKTDKDSILISAHFGIFKSSIEVEQGKLYECVVTCSPISAETPSCSQTTNSVNYNTSWKIETTTCTIEDFLVIETETQAFKKKYGIPFYFFVGKGQNQIGPIFVSEDVPKFPEDDVAHLTLKTIRDSKPVMETILDLDPEAYAYLKQVDKFFPPKSL